MSLYKSTLDIDTTDKEFIKRTILKICCCKYLIDIQTKHSNNKGIHIILGCIIECDICRICYDDFKRFAYDQQRPEWARNILFDVKEYG